MCRGGGGGGGSRKSIPSENVYFGYEKSGLSSSRAFFSLSCVEMESELKTASLKLKSRCDV
jgi:hypothetical protein